MSWDNVPITRPKKVEETLPTADTTEGPVKFTFERLGQRMMFGLVLGGVCGAAYGATDALTLLQPSSKPAGGRRRSNVIAESLKKSRNGVLVFGGFFAAFQGVKYGALTARGVHDPSNTVAALAVAAAPLVVSPVTRAYAPYALMLVAIDAFNEAGYTPTGSKT